MDEKMESIIPPPSMNESKPTDKNTRAQDDLVIEDSANGCKVSRYLLNVISPSTGMSLRKSYGPARLLAGILDAILCHQSLFKAGWLHRGINMDSVLVEKRTRELPPGKYPLLPLSIQLEYGVIAGGDNIVDWRKLNREIIRPRPDALPFVSIRLLKNMGKPDLHTAVDELESFYWLLLWSILVITRSYGLLLEHETRWLQHLKNPGDNCLFAAIYKTAIMTEVSNSETRSSAAFAFFKNLLLSWGGIASEHRSLTSELMNSSEGVTADALLRNALLCYGKYLKTGISFSENLEFPISIASWNEVFYTPRRKRATSLNRLAS